MITKLLGFFKGKGGLLLGALVALAGIVAAVFARGRKQGVLEQRVASEDKEDAARAELRRIEAENVARSEAREHELAAARAANEAAPPEARPTNAASARAKAQAAALRAKIARRRNP